MRPKRPGLRQNTLATLTGPERSVSEGPRSSTAFDSKVQGEAAMGPIAPPAGGLPRPEEPLPPRDLDFRPWVLTPTPSPPDTAAVDRAPRVGSLRAHWGSLRGGRSTTRKLAPSATTRSPSSSSWPGTNNAPAGSERILSYTATLSASVLKQSAKPHSQTKIANPSLGGPGDPVVGFAETCQAIPWAAEAVSRATLVQSHLRSGQR